VEMFALNDEVARLRAELAGLVGQPDRAGLLAMVTLAWYLRQRDTAQALQLADRARALLRGADDAEAHGLAVRLKLVYGEAKWLYAELGEAQALAQRALQDFGALGDPVGCADAHWLLSCIAVDQGWRDRVEAELEAAALQAREAADHGRLALIESELARHLAFQNWRLAAARWDRRLRPIDIQTPPALLAVLCDYRSAMCSFSGDPGGALSHAIKAFDAAQQSGQIRRAIVAASNAGYELSSLNDQHASLEWMQRSLDLARPTGWPASVGRSLQQTADTLVQLGRLDAGQELLAEALQMLAPLAGSRAYAIALCSAGHLAHAQGDHGRAYDCYCQVQQRAEALSQTDFHIMGMLGQAQNLFRLDQPLRALEVALSGLALAREQHDVFHQIELLRLLAEIHASQPLPLAGADGVPAVHPTLQCELKGAVVNAPLHFLEQALKLASGIEGYSVTGDLLDALAREYANVGSYLSAYNICQQANQAREKIRSQKATNLSIVMQVQHQTEQARAEAEHLRQLAASEAGRAEVLQQTGMTLLTLGAIGQEITANLDQAAVFQALDRHVHSLLDATCFMVYLLDEAGDTLEMAFGMEDGKPLPHRRLALADSPTQTALCARERREIKLDVSPDSADCATLIPGTLPTLSLLFAPLVVHDRLLGVMSLQSPRPQAYAEREQLIFRNLCAYGAIALDNAAAYRQLHATLGTLRETQAQLLQKNLELEQANCALEQVSLTDTLTGLRNRRFLQQQLDGDVAITLRQHEEWLKAGGHGPNPDNDLIFFMVDLDQFKKVNDHHGHAVGDRLLVQMRERLLEVFRESDYLVRWGGEEFLVVARASKREDAPTLAERIRKAVADRHFDLGDGVRLANTCSLGFACYPFIPKHPQLLSWHQVVELADQGLYMAKRAGRNAWFGLVGKERHDNSSMFERLMRGADQAVHAGELQVVSSLNQA